jgi:hypothetical protein
MGGKTHEGEAPGVAIVTTEIVVVGRQPFENANPCACDTAQDSPVVLCDTPPAIRRDVPDVAGAVDAIGQKDHMGQPALGLARNARGEHEMIDDELAASGEQVRQRFLPVGSVEDVFLSTFYPRRLASLRVRAVARFR